MYRHAHALRLFGKRQRNIRRCLERIIERADYAQMTLSGAVSAIQACVKLNGPAQAIEQAEGTNPNELLELILD